MVDVFTLNSIDLGRLRYEPLRVSLRVQLYPDCPHEDMRDTKQI